MELTETKCPIPDDKMKELREAVSAMCRDCWHDLAAVHVGLKLQPEKRAITAGYHKLMHAVAKRMNERIQGVICTVPGTYMDLPVDVVVQYAEAMVDEEFDRFEAAL